MLIKDECPKVDASVQLILH